MGNKRYYLVRIGQIFFLLWFILTLLFFFFRLLPGDFTSIMTFQGASQETVQAVREQWGLDDPLHIQYLRYMENFLQGNVGKSVTNNEPVIEYIRMRMFNTFILVAPAVTIGYILGSLLGTLFGMARGSKFEEYGLIPVIFAGSFPSFFIALIMVIVFATILGWFPTSGIYSYEVLGQYDHWWGVYTSESFLHHYLLPFSTIVLRYLYSPTLIMRTSVVDTMSQDFTFYHRITGLDRTDRMKHIMRHSILPVITLYPVSMTRAIGGLVLIETVFSWPGIGQALVQAVLNRDYPVVQFVFFLVAAFVVIANFAVDILYGIIDPRVTVSGDEE